MKEPLVYIIILNWNGLKDTIECIESLKNVLYKNYKIVIVENGSTDNSKSTLIKKYPHIKLISNSDNLGFAEGSNIGINFALKNKAKYILLLNNDTTVDKNFLSELINVAEMDVHNGIIGPLIYSYSIPHVTWFAGGKIDYLNGPFRHMGLPANERTLVKEVDFITGCCLLIRSEVIKKVGLLDKNYFAYVEDVDLNIRAKYAGYKVIFAPQSFIFHKVSSSSGGIRSSLRDYYTSRNLILFAKKNLSGINQFFFLLSFIKSQLLRLIKYFFHFELYKCLALIRGTYKGITTS